MKNKLIYALIIVIVLFIGVGIFAIVNRTNNNRLKEEVKILSSLNFYEDNFDRKCVTSFGYKDVEKSFIQAGFLAYLIILTIILFIFVSLLKDTNRHER